MTTSTRDPFSRIPSPDDEYAGTVLETASEREARGAVTLACKSCGKPVERCFDDDWQHATLEDDLACTAWPVFPSGTGKEASNAVPD